MTSYLPEDMEEDTIDKMSPGESGYTVPWAMFVDENRRLWINKHYMIMPRPFRETIHMKVTMLKDRVVLVDKSTIGDYKYTIGCGWNPEETGLPVELE